MKFKIAGFAALACIALAGCQDARPSPAVSPQLDSGVTSSNGGGQRALGNLPNATVNGATGAATVTTGQSANGKGSAY